MNGSNATSAGDLPSFLRIAAAERPSQPAYIFGSDAIPFKNCTRIATFAREDWQFWDQVRGRVALLVSRAASFHADLRALSMRGHSVLIDPGIGHPPCAMPCRSIPERLHLGLSGPSGADLIRLGEQSVRTRDRGAAMVLGRCFL